MSHFGSSGFDLSVRFKVNHFRFRDENDIDASLTQAIYENDGSTKIPSDISRNNQNINDMSLFGVPLNKNKLTIIYLFGRRK